MYKVKFNTYEFPLIEGGYSVLPEQAEFKINAEMLSLAAVEEVVENPANLEKIYLIDEEKEEPVEVISDLTAVKSLRKIYDYTTGVYDDEGQFIEETFIIIDVVVGVPGLKEAVKKNSADIEYIAIMTDIEL